MNHAATTTPTWLAQRMQVIKPSPSMAAKRKVDQLRAEGRRILDFTIGEPDVGTPAHIALAGIAAIGRGETKYTATSGTPGLLAAVQRKYQRENQLAFASSQLIAGTGAKQLIFAALQATLNAGDEVIIPAPYWVSYPDMVKLNDGTPVTIPTQAAQGFKITPAQLKASLTPRTKWVMLNAPNNPSGAMYRADELQALLAVLAEHPQVLLMVDEIYEHFSYGEPYVSPLQIAPTMAARTLLVNGVSKAYAMTGWRLGYAAGPDWLIRAMSTLISQSTSCPSQISQAAAQAALDGDQQCVREIAALFRQRRDRMVVLLNAIPGVHCTLPDGAFYAFPSVQGLLGRRTPAGVTLETDVDVVHYLLEAADVALLDGSAYGCPGYLRASFATDLATIEAGCERLALACRQLT